MVQSLSPDKPPIRRYRRHDTIVVPPRRFARINRANPPMKKVYVVLSADRMHPGHLYIVWTAA